MRWIHCGQPLAQGFALRSVPLRGSDGLERLRPRSDAEFGEHHERVIAAPRAAIEQAMDTVTVGQVRLLAPLMVVRARLARPAGQGLPGLRGDRPLADALGLGFEWFVRDPGLQVFVTVR